MSRNDYQITPEAWESIRPRLKRMKETSLALAYDVLVRGLSQAEAREQHGMTKQQASWIVARVREEVDKTLPKASLLTGDAPREQVNEVAEALTRVRGKTKAARLRPLLPIIDRKVREGVEHGELVEELNRYGFDLNVHTFRTNLYRYRRKLREGDAKHKDDK